MEQNERRFAVLIDADNVSPKYIKYILDEVSDVGIATYKRIYGDWTDNEKRSWKNVLLDWSVNPIQQYSYTTGKNSTDSAMIIDAMDILYSGTCDGFVLVSSDSDFTRLATRLREAGMEGVRHGGEKNAETFYRACDKFVYIEVIRAAAKQAAEAAKKKEEAQPRRRPRRRTRSARPPAVLPRRRSWSSSPSRWRTCARRTGWPIWASWATSC